MHLESILGNRSESTYDCTIYDLPISRKFVKLSIRYKISSNVFKTRRKPEVSLTKSTFKNIQNLCIFGTCCQCKAAISAFLAVKL